MRIVIVGDGKVGSELSVQLSEEGHDIIVIDSNKSVLREAVEALDVMVVHGNGAALRVQTAADVAHSDLLIAATSADETNLLCCMLARKLGCPHTIARVRNMEYASQLFLMKEELGLSMYVNPELTAASEIFRMLQFPSFLQRDSFVKGRVEIVEFQIRDGSKLIGKKLSDLYRIAKVNVLVCAVERGDEVFIPDGNFMLQERDIVFVTASTTDLAKLIRNMDIYQRKIKAVMLIGGSRTAIYLARELLDAGINVKLIEKDEEKSMLLAEILPSATIILADGTEKGVLDAEGIEKTDAVVTLTNMDEENLIISMYADFVGVPKVVTKINRTEYYEVFRDKGIKSIVSPKELCSRDIVRYVRAMQNTLGNAVMTLHRIGQMEALEFHVDENICCVDITLKDLKLKKNILIACIIRGNRILIPKGNDTLENGDDIVVVTTVNRVISDLDEIFDESFLREVREGRI